MLTSMWMIEMQMFVESVESKESIRIIINQLNLYMCMQDHLVDHDKVVVFYNNGWENFP